MTVQALRQSPSFQHQCGTNQCATEGLTGSEWMVSFLLEHTCHLTGALRNFIPRSESCGISGPLVGGRHTMCLGSRFSLCSSPCTPHSCAPGGPQFPLSFRGHSSQLPGVRRRTQPELTAPPLPSKHSPRLGGRCPCSYGSQSRGKRSIGNTKWLVRGYVLPSFWNNSFTEIQHTL